MVLDRILQHSTHYLQLSQMSTFKMSTFLTLYILIINQSEHCPYFGAQFDGYNYHQADETMGLYT